MSAPAQAPLVLGLASGARDAAAAEHDAHAAATALEAAGLTEVVAGWTVTTHVVRDRTAYVAVAASWAPTDAAAGAPVVDLLAGAVPGATLAVGMGPTRLHLGGVGDRPAGARAAMEEHRARDGRLVRFPGSERLVGTWTVGDLVGSGLLDAVEGLAGTDVGPDAVVELADFARPAWRGGRRVLLVQPGPGGLVPFEARDQVACCHDH